MASELDLKTIGRRIRFQREQMDLTREELAEKLEVSAKFCADIEYGMKGMSMTTLNRISEILNLSTDYILRGNNDIHISSTDNRDIIESVVATLESCSRVQLGRVEQLLRLFVSAVGDTPGAIDES
jgi:transcriptional regulator with XRE-family HTH domain